MYGDTAMRCFVSRTTVYNVKMYISSEVGNGGIKEN